MGFLKRLFGGGKQAYQDNGIYLHFRSKRAADAVTKVRINPTHDLNNDGGGYVWHKTIVDSRYFSRIQAEIRFDGSYNVTSSDLDGGELISAEEYERAMAERNKPAEPEPEPEEDAPDADEPAAE